MQASQDGVIKQNGVTFAPAITPATSPRCRCREMGPQVWGRRSVAPGVEALAVPLLAAMPTPGPPRGSQASTRTLPALEQRRLQDPRSWLHQKPQWTPGKLLPSPGGGGADATSIRPHPHSGSQGWRVWATWTGLPRPLGLGREGEGRGLIWPLCLLLTPEEQTLPIWVLLPREPGGASVEGVPASQGQSLKRHAAAGTCQGERDLKLELSPLPTGEPWPGRWFWQDPEQMRSPPSSSSPGLLLECAISRARQASRGQRSNVVCSTRSRVALELRDSATVTSTVHPSGSPAAALRGPWHTRGLPPAAAALPGFDSQDGHFLSAVTLVPEKGHKVPVILYPSLRGLITLQDCHLPM
ncbi:uncharacterized protein [Marmota flaviventris]|uniref:uncharacterized protein isoform X2 n=1 Tax=Marmota flaviventris TaxID=93162 RepID=UPI003A87C4BC